MAIKLPEFTFSRFLWVPIDRPACKGGLGAGLHGIEARRANHYIIKSQYIMVSFMFNVGKLIEVARELAMHLLNVFCLYVLCC